MEDRKREMKRQQFVVKEMKLKDAKVEGKMTKKLGHLKTKGMKRKTVENIWKDVLIGDQKIESRREEFWFKRRSGSQGVRRSRAYVITEVSPKAAPRT